MKMNLLKIEFEFSINNNRYLVSWYPKGSEYYSDYAANESEKGSAYEVTISRGGTYKSSFYTSYNANKSNSADFLKSYLESD
jgi:hypothetical protein